MKSKYINYIKAWVLLNIIFIPSVLIINVYGLDEFRDDYLNETYVQAKDQTVRNTTYNCMELLYGLAVSTPENFSDGWIETDSENDLTVYDFNITWFRMDRLCDARVIKDYGANHFGLNWEHHLEVKFTELEAGDGSFRNQIHLYQVSASGAGEMFRFTTVQNADDDTQIAYSFIQKSGGINQFSDTVFLADIGKAYWLNLTKDNTNFYFKVYNNSLMTAPYLEYSSSKVGLHINYRILNMTTSLNNVNDPDDYSSGYVKVLNLNEGGGLGYYETGTFYTTNLLEDLNNESVVLLYNCSLNGGSIESEYSNDNSTWIDHNGVGGSDNLVDGFESIDLRDLNYNVLYTRFNYTRGLAQTTPRLYQIIIHTNDPISEGEEYSALLFVGFILGLILMFGIASKK